MPDEELERVKTRIVSGWFAALESRVERSTELAHAVAFGDGAASLAALPARLAAVTPGDVSRAAAWLHPGRRAAIVKEPEAA